MSFSQYFKDIILPQIISSGCFGENPEVLSVKDSSEEKEEFMSCVKFLDVELKVGEGSETIPLFCKFENEATMEQKRELFQTDLQFFNEVLVYKEFISSSPDSVAKMFPKFYFSRATSDRCPITSVIILENLMTKGFEHSRERVFLDFDHCSLAFQKLGEFHGMSLHMKTENPLKFENKVKQLSETKWMSNRRERQNYFYGETTKRGVIPLMKSGENLDILNAFLDRLSDVHSVIKDILEVNKHSVLCHGDFCSNNMVFKYSTPDENPVDVKFFDLGTARHASPIIDISFFLFLNTTADTRRKHFKNDLLKIYLEAVKKYAGSAAPTMEELWEEFQRKAVYGYLLASFFLPIMCCRRDPDPDCDDLVEITKQNLRKGGQEMTDILSEIVRDLVTWGCVEKTVSSDRK